MSTRKSRRYFLKQGALPLLATSLCLTRPTESNALQQPRREGPFHTGDLEGTPYPTEERTNRSDGYNLRERVTYVCGRGDRKSTRLNSSHLVISYAVFCLKKKKKNTRVTIIVKE